MEKDLEQKLITLEKKYGGLQQNIIRNVKSSHEKNYYTTHQGGDRMKSKYHNYASHYAKFMMPLVGKQINLAEVGILNGIGLSIWSDVFDNSKIFGFDIDVDIFHNNFKKLKSLDAFQNNSPVILEFDQFLDNKDYIKKNIKEDKFQIVIDDGCHQNIPIINTFESFLPYLADDFVYFIEDNTNVYKHFIDKYPNFEIFYKDQMTIITPKR